MPNQTQTYKFDNFKRGSLYSATSDYQRFTTLDYNMESYIGIVGGGITNGWEIEPISDLIIKILPGKGVIDGFMAESPYLYKKRSEINMGEREIEVIKTDPLNSLEEDLTEEERIHYINCIQSYDPDYNPIGPIENVYAKFVIPSEFELLDDADNFVYAERPLDARPYPYPLNDYPELTLDVPVRRDFPNYSEFQTAQQEYQQQIQMIHEYNWRENPDNHFTSINLKISPVRINQKNHLLLGKIITRNGSINEIDLSDVQNIANMQSFIKNLARRMIENHYHNAKYRFSPTHIRLETHIRKAIVRKQYSNNIKKYDVLSEIRTTSNQNHQHSYYIDANGNGYTLDVFGDGEFHFHFIDNWIVSESRSEQINRHRHQLINVDLGEWDVNDKFNVWVNNIVYGNEENVKFYTTEHQLLMDGFNNVFKTYEIHFDFISTLRTRRKNRNSYHYISRELNLYDFIKKMTEDFIQKHGIPVPRSNPENLAEYIEDIDYPFLFVRNQELRFINREFLYSSDLEIQLEMQGAIGDYHLTKNNDYFYLSYPLYNPNQLKINVFNVSNLHDEIKVEFLEKTEVQGILPLENISYLNAKKILTGVFNIERIPFISHNGEYTNSIFPFTSHLGTNNFINYTADPFYTSISLNHYHDIIIDQFKNGTTGNIYDEYNNPIYFLHSENGESYNIRHNHEINNGIIKKAESNNLNILFNEPTHEHEIQYKKPNNTKTIYSIYENKYGDLFLGTSNGTYCIPSEKCVEIIINGESICFIGENVTDFYNEAISYFENKHSIVLIRSNAVRQAILNDLNEQKNQILHDELIFYQRPYGSIRDENGRTREIRNHILVKTTNSFPVRNFHKIHNKNIKNLEANDEIINIEFIGNNEIIMRPQDINLNNYKNIEGIANVKENLNINTFHKILSKKDFAENEFSNPNGNEDDIEIEDVFLIGFNNIIKQRHIRNNLYEKWDVVDNLKINGMIQDIKIDDKNTLWIGTSNGLYLSTNSQNLNSIVEIQLNSFNKDIKGIEILNNKIFITILNEIYVSNDYGINWELKGNFNENITEITKDLLLNDLYIVIDNSIIYKSNDFGETWEEICRKDFKDSSNIFALNDSLLVSYKNGLYQYNDNKWMKILNDRIYCFLLSSNNTDIYLGSVNKLYKTSNFIDFEILVNFYGDNSPTIKRNNNIEYYKYNYNFFSNTFNFNFIQNPNDKIIGMIDNSQWEIRDPKISQYSNYEIKIDNQIVFSKKDGLINESRPLSVNESQQIIDFSIQSNITRRIVGQLDAFLQINDNGFLVQSSNGLKVGDIIEIIGYDEEATYEHNKYKKIIESFKNINTDRKPDIAYFSDYYNTLRIVKEQLMNVSKNNSLLKKNYHITKIISINGNQIMIEDPIKINFNYPSYIRKILDIDSLLNVEIKTYQNSLINSGEFSHQEIENKLSKMSDFRSYNMNNIYLGNLLNLNQALKNIYPEITSEQINSMFYNFNYSEHELENHIDIKNSEANSLAWYENNITRQNKANRIYKIVVGSQQFEDLIIVATNIGLFYTWLKDGIEHNWKYVFEIDQPIYDVLIYHDKIYIVSESGLYYSEDLIEWKKESSLTINFKINKISPRWIEKNDIIIPNHSVTLKNENNFGKIISHNVSYQNITPGSIIQISNAGEISGHYSVIKVANKEITIGTKFNIGNEDISISIQIIQKSFFNNLNPVSQNILIAAGDNKIIYQESNAWKDSIFPNEINRFYPYDIILADNNNALISFYGEMNQKSLTGFLHTNTKGDSWEELLYDHEIQCLVNNIEINKNGNTIIHANNIDDKKVFNDGELQNRTFSVQIRNNLYNEKIIWNTYENGLMKLILLGDRLYQLASTSIINQTGNINPIHMKKTYKMPNGELILGTNHGLYKDKKTYDNPTVEMDVIRMGHGGIIKDVGKKLTIRSIQPEENSNNAVLTCDSNFSLGFNELQHQLLYIIGEDNEPINILLNDNEFLGKINIMVDKNYNEMKKHAGKDIKIIAKNSNIIVESNFLVEKNNLKNGGIYIDRSQVSQDLERYKILSNDHSYIIINDHIVDNSVSSAFSPKVVFNGTKFAIVKEDKTLDIFVRFNKEMLNNELSGKYLQYVTNDNQIFNLLIYSNTNNMISLKDDDYSEFLNRFFNNEIKRYFVTNFNFYKIEEFSYMETAMNLNHYHDIYIIEDNITGKIENINTTNNGMLVSFSEISGWNSIFNEDTMFLQNVLIKLYNPNNHLHYFSEIVNMNESSILIKEKNINWWGNGHPNEFKISKDWHFEVIVKNCGITTATFYKDFVISINKLIQNINKDDVIISINDTSHIEVNDKLEIFNILGFREIHYVKSIINSNQIELFNPVTSNSYIAHDTSIKVLRDHYENNHVHRIKYNEIESVNILSFAEKGYPESHSHTLVSYMDSINDIIFIQNKLMIVGNNSKISSSYDLKQWNIEFDLNEFNNADDINRVYNIVPYNHDLIAGTSNGHLFSTLLSDKILKLKPIFVE